jgi:hypothetical protein
MSDMPMRHEDDDFEELDTKIEEYGYEDESDIPDDLVDLIIDLMDEEEQRLLIDKYVHETPWNKLGFTNPQAAKKRWETLMSKIKETAEEHIDVSMDTMQDLLDRLCGKIEEE